MTPCIRILLAAVVAASFSTAARAQDSGAVSVAAVRVYESRSKTLDRKSYVDSNYLGVTLRFKGEPIKKLSRLGNWQVATAKDDQGTSLLKTSFSDKNLYRTYRYSYTTLKPDEYDHYYSLNAPKRGAKMLTNLAGTVQLSISDSDTVTIPVSKLNELSGKTVADPVLKKAGLTVTLDRVTLLSTSTYASVKFTGSKVDREKFLLLRFEDKAGKVITQTTPSPATYGSSTQGNGYVSISRRLNPDDVLKMEIETKRSDITVRFDLKDIPLP